MWVQYNFLQPLNQEQVLGTGPMGLNSAICVQNLPTINIKAIKRGMFQIKDIVHENGTFLTYEELCDKFCTPLAFIPYYGIIQAIP